MTGFLQAEGTFTFSRNGRSLNLVFGVKRQTPDEPLLRELRSFFGGIGRIYEVGGQQVSTGYPRSQRLFRVTRRDELPRIVAHLEAYPLRGRRAATFALWREMVQLKLARFRRPDVDRLEQLAQALSAQS